MSEAALTRAYPCMPSSELTKEPQNIVFLGGIFTPGQSDLIQRESKGVIQNAADALQKSIIEGLSLTYPGKVSVVNLPYISAYPVAFNKAIFPATTETMFSNVEIHGSGFIVLRYVKPFSRALSAFLGLRRASTVPPIVVVYAAHLPFLWAVIAYRMLTPKSRICLILPDFPEFMGEGGWLYNLAKSIESRIFYGIARSIDCFVLLTEAMAERMDLSPDRFVVVEGIAALSADGVDPQPENARIFLYSGTLAGRYGILELLKAFRGVRNSQANLWICGEGDSREAVIEAARQDHRIRFLGQLPRGEVTKIQRTVSVLVNPRLPVGDFVKYSFPSKTLEYMSSGRPVLMYDLPGVPADYRPHYFSPEDNTVSGLTKAIETLAAESVDILSDKGTAARKFVEEHKSVVPQGRKITELLLAIQSRSPQ